VEAKNSVVQKNVFESVMCFTYCHTIVLKQFSLLCLTFKDITYVFSLCLKINLSKVYNLEMICCWLFGFNDRVTELR